MYDPDNSWSHNTQALKALKCSFNKKTLPYSYNITHRNSNFCYFTALTLQIVWQSDFFFFMTKEGWENGHLNVSVTTNNPQFLCLFIIRCVCLNLTAAAMNKPDGKHESKSSENKNKQCSSKRTHRGMSSFLTQHHVTVCDIITSPQNKSITSISLVYDLMLISQILMIKKLQWCPSVKNVCLLPRYGMQETILWLLMKSRRRL